MYDLCPLIFNYYLFDFLNPLLSLRFPLILSTDKGFSFPYLYQVGEEQGIDHDEEAGHVWGPCQCALLEQHICEQYNYKHLLNGTGRGVPSNTSALMIVGAGNGWGELATDGGQAGWLSLDSTCCSGCKWQSPPAWSIAPVSQTLLTLLSSHFRLCSAFHQCYLRALQMILV